MTSFMLILTIINALPVKQRMKNAFLENHIFTEYNLSMNDMFDIVYIDVKIGELYWQRSNIH